MDKVQFPCGHCGQLLAVPANLAGQAVRCPHCQQVVTAPAAAPALAAAPPPAPPEAPPAPDLLQETRFTLPGVAEQDSIFSQQEEEDLFGATARPRVEFPPEPPPPEPPPPAVPPADRMTPPTVPAAEVPPPVGETVACVPPPPAGRDANAPTEVVLPGPSPWPGADAGTPTAPDVLAGANPRPQVRVPREKGGAWFYVIAVCLFSYSVLATVLVVLLLLRLQQRPEPINPLEYLPDVDGDHPGARRQGSGQRKRMRWPVDTPLGESQITRVGQPIRIGDLEVTPGKPEWRVVKIQVGNGNPEPQDEESLVLPLRLRNVSADVSFYPLDSFFDRRWKEKGGTQKLQTSYPPYTYLELTDTGRRFYGGPTPWWKDNPNSRFSNPRERVLGQNYDRELKPGEELESFVCTDADDHVKQALANYQGGLRWRIQVRRGLVAVGDREPPATAVIGVDFTAADVRNGG